MLTLSLKGYLRNWLGHVKFNGLDRSAFISMAIVQYAIVICVKDNGGSVKIERERELKLRERSMT